MTNDNQTTENLQKVEFLEQLFQEQKGNYNHNGKNYINMTIKCNNKALNKHLNNLKNKYGKSHTLDEFVSEFILWSWKAIERFEIKDGGSWEEILDGTDKANIGRLIQNIKVTTQHQLYRYANTDAQFTKGEVDGVKGQHIVVKMEFESLDAVLEGSVDLIETLTDNHSLFNNTMYSYYITYFQKWYEENKVDILTKSQLKFLEDLRRTVTVEGINNIKEVTGTSPDAINKRLNRISKRIEDAWTAQNPTYKNRLELKRDEELEMWNNLLKVVYSDEIELTVLNQVVTNKVVEKMETDVVEELIHSVLDSEEMIFLNRIVKAGGKHPISLKAKTLYKILEAVEKRVDQLEQQTFHTEAVTKEIDTKLQVWKEEKKKRDKQEAKVYTLEGEYLRTEPHKAHQRKNNIIYILPSGLRVATDGVLE